MSEIREPILRLPESVKRDMAGYREKVGKFVAGDSSAISFKAYRVPMGIYEQRRAGKYMVRIRIGAGLVWSYQLEKIAALSKTCGNGVVHVTTRQDLQIHEVDIENTPDVLEGLLEVGLSSRGGGGNTVRNITTCPQAGICPQEVFNVAPYAIAAAEYLLDFPSSFNLPRKFKIVFSGCATDCAFASVADLGFFAHVKEGQKGFAVYAGGGLGPNPRIGIKVEEFIRTDEILEVAEAVKRLFDKYGDRMNRQKARLRYVLGRVGDEEFVKLYRNEREKVQKEGLPGSVPEIRDADVPFPGPDHFPSPDRKGGDPDRKQPIFSDSVMPEKTPGLYTVRLKLKLGDIPADDLAKVAQIAEKYADGLVRTTQLQNLLITSVSAQNLESVIQELKNLSMDITENHQPKIVACTGAATCKLGLCLSRGLADAIIQEFQDKKKSPNANDMVVRISGCPNSCGNHYLADIGFEGKAKRIHGRLMPFYEVFADAKITEGQTQLAERIGSIPAKRIPDFMAEAFANGNRDQEQLKKIVARYSETLPDWPEEYYHDFGADKPFSLAGRGPGECGAGVMDVFQVDIDEAQDALRTAEKTADHSAQNEAIYKAVLASARALLIVFGLEPKKDREIFRAFQQHLIEPAWVDPKVLELTDAAIDWRLGDLDTLTPRIESVRELIDRIEELFRSLDANLKFRVDPIAEKNTTITESAQSHRVDLRGVTCPMNFVKAKLELEKIQPGEILEVLLDDGEPIRNVPASFAEQGQEVLETKLIENYFSLRVKRKH